jgi:hypothetical protein
VQREMQGDFRVLTDACFLSSLFGHQLISH